MIISADLSNIRLGLGLRDSLLDKMRVDGDALGAVVCLVDAHQSVRQLKHVGPDKMIKIVFYSPQYTNLNEMMMN